jgi:hypothetical protein
VSDPSDEPTPDGDQPLWRRLLAFIIALSILGIGIWLLVDLWGGTPVAADFTRVGGETRVETALEASRFWPYPPPGVVTISGASRPDIMLKAAKCAMAHDAPLLFTLPDPKLQLEVTATITTWEKDAARDHAPFTSWDETDLDKCQGGAKLDLSGLSTLKIPGEPSELPRKYRTQESLNPLIVKGVTAQDNLASMVVFAAAKAPGDPPDIAVGLVLAAHLARANKVSIVDVPRYLEADPMLEKQLREQPLVQDGIVLGEPNIMPEDTRALLRQLLTSADQQSFLGETRDTLGSVAPLVAALLALFGLGKAVTTAPKKDEWKDIGAWIGKRGAGLRDGAVKPVAQGIRALLEFIVEMTTAPVTRIRSRREEKRREEERSSSKPQPPLADWLSLLNEKEKKGQMTIRLVSGREVTGRIPERLRNDRTTLIVRLDVTDAAKNEKEQKYSILVRVEDIESIRVPLLSPTVTGVSLTSGPAAGGDTVTVTGTGFTDASGVSFGTVPASSLAVISDTQLTVTSPAAADAGPVAVTVTTPAGTSAATPADQYTYS